MKITAAIVSGVAALSVVCPSNAFVPSAFRTNAPVGLGEGAITTSLSNSFFTRNPIGASTSTTLWYELSNDPNAEKNRPNAWSVLATTEKWMTNTLADAATETGNPLSRKEVSYVCETSNDAAMILANVFRKLKEFRQLGEKHGNNQEELVDEQGDQHKRSTLRQTQVLVIPANGDFNDKFQVFDSLIQAINQARRNARDYVTEASLEKLDDRIYGDGDRDWSVSVNFAHLHPRFGEKSPEQELKEMQEEEKQGEVDLNLKEYQERKMIARRSPYPSVVVEVRSTPPPDFSKAPPAGPRASAQMEVEEVADPESELGYKEEEVTSEFVQQLEALFSKSAHIKDDEEGKDPSQQKKKSNDKFYDSIGSHIEEISMVTPMMMAQTWISENDPLFNVQASGFTVSDTKFVDEAYEFVFTNLAMQTSQFLTSRPFFAVDEAATGAQKETIFGNVKLLNRKCNQL